MYLLLVTTTALLVYITYDKLPSVPHPKRLMLGGSRSPQPNAVRCRVLPMQLNSVNSKLISRRNHVAGMVMVSVFAGRSMFNGLTQKTRSGSTVT
jgi:hypothetical protein